MERAHLNAVLRLAMVLACCGAFALDPSLDISQYAHTSWKVRDGFVKGAITSLAQTSDGYLWLGTEFGLYHFDGVRAVQWQPPPSQQLPSTHITGLLAARDGTLWIGTWKGLASWKNGKLTTYPELSDQLVFAMLEDREGAVWIGSISNLSSGRLCSVCDGSLQCSGEDGSLGPIVADLFEDTKGNLWVGVQNGVWRWKPGSSQFFSVPGEPDGVRFGGEDEAGLIIGGDGGLHYLKDGHVQPFSAAHKRFQPLTVSRVLRDRDGTLWAGTTDRGLIHIHNGKTDGFSQSDTLTSNVVTYILEDREGSVWVATQDGLDRFRSYSVPTISVKQGLSTSNPYSILEARDGSVLIGTSNGLNKWERGGITLLDVARRSQKSAGKLSRFSPESMFQDSEGRLWVSTYYEFGDLEDNRFIPVTAVPSGYVHSITEVPAGHLWVAYQDAGLFHLSLGKVVRQIPWAGLGHKDHVNVMVADPSQSGMWLGFFGGGVAYFAHGGIRDYYSSGNGLGEGVVNDLRFGPRGALWVATEGGLSRIKDGKVATLTRKNGLPCDSVLWTMEDDGHAFWLLMPCGLVRVIKSELDAWVADPTKDLSTTVVDSSDGVRSRSILGGYTPHVTKSSDGRIWFTAYDGVSVIDPHHVSFNKLPPPVHIEQIVADENTYDPASSLRLPARVRDLLIDYTALSLVVPEKVHFRVKLEGQDKDWRELNDRHVHYTNLAPHHYRFRVAACNNSGVWNEEGASLDFMIPPAWYQTSWFRALCAAAFLAFLWMLHQLRIWKLKQREKQFREAVETIPAIAWVSRLDGSCEFANQRWSEYTGLPVAHTAGSGWQSAIHPEDLNRYTARWRVSVENGRSFEEELRLQKADGEYRWFLSRAVPLRDKRGKILRWYGISTDIEDRKRAERLEADLAQVNRVSMLGELAASLSHELKQPIAATITNANTSLRWLKRDEPDFDELRQAAERIVKDGARAADIIDRLRSLYKKSPPQRELLDVNEIIHEMVVLLRSEAYRYAVSIRTDLAGDLPRVMADRVQLQQVFMNLMLNGIEAMKDTGGVLTVTSQAEDGRVLISVSDTGVGLPAEKADQIFDAFFTTKPQGSGMGLAISRSILESHGGRLWATANDGRGATFYFTLPTATEEPKAPTTEHTPDVTF